MKKTILSLATILALGLTGCGGGSGEDSTTGVALTVKYADGTTFGITRAEDEQVNGGYTVYDVGTGEQIGFIQLDGAVNDMNGVDLGVCQGALDEKGDFTAECTVPTANPTIHPEEPSTGVDGGGTADNGNGAKPHQDPQPTPKPPKPQPSPTPDNSGDDAPLVDPDADGGATGGSDADSSGAGGQGSETGAGN